MVGLEAHLVGTRYSRGVLCSSVMPWLLKFFEQVTMDRLDVFYRKRAFEKDTGLCVVTKRCGDG
jgi:hypothetical protein